MKKIAVLLLCALLAALLLSCRQDTDPPPDITPPVTSDTDETTPAETLPPVTSDTDETTPAETLPSGAEMTLEEILRTDPYYDVDEALAEVTKWIQGCISNYQEAPHWFEQYSGWIDYEIADIVPTHSQKTGFITGFVFEIFNENGERSYVFYDFPTDTIVEHPQAASPFFLFGEEINKDPWLLASVGTPKPENVFYFAHVEYGFGYGILQEDGSVIIYDTNTYIRSLYYGKKDLQWQQLTIDNLWSED